MVTLLRTVNVKVSKAFYYVSSRPLKVSTSQSSHMSACVVGERLVSRNSGWGSSLAVAFFLDKKRRCFMLSKQAFVPAL